MGGGVISPADILVLVLSLSVAAALIAWLISRDIIAKRNARLERGAQLSAMDAAAHPLAGRRS